MEITFSTFVNEDVFVCGLCKAIFTSLIVYLDHKKSPCSLGEYTVNELSDVVCEGNNKTINTCEQYQLTTDCEVQTEETTIKYICAVCQKTYKKLHSFELHSKVHSEDKSFQCPICGRCFVQSSHVREQRHLQTHKVWPNGLSATTSKTKVNELLSYVCPYCDTTLANYSCFRIHLKAHKALKKFKCIQSDCVNLFENIEMLLDHVTQNHIPPIFTCHVCSATFNNLPDIASHQSKHLKSDTKTKIAYRCAECDATFRSKSTLALHLSTDNHNKCCIHCNKVFASNKRLRLHLQIHRNVKPFHCGTCGKSFSIKKYLNSHMLKHGEKLHVCTICDFKFKRRDVLSRHMKLHQSNKKLQCPYRDKFNCKMEFTRTDKLKLHIKTHTIKPQTSIDSF